MPTWDELAKGLQDRVEAWSEQRRAAERQQLYESWVTEALRTCQDDLERECRTRMSHLCPATRAHLQLTSVPPSWPRAGGHGLSLRFGPDEVCLQLQRPPTAPPCVHLLWSRQRNGRLCQVVPLSAGQLLPKHDLHGYWIRCPFGSGDELTTEHVVQRALGLLTSGCR